MTTKTLKKQLHEVIDHVESEQLLKAVYIILNNNLQQTKEALKPFTLDEFHDRQKQSQKDIAKGKLVDHKTLKKRYASK